MSGFKDIAYHDMSGGAQHLLQGLDPRAFELAKNPAWQQRLADFLTEFDHAFPEQEELHGSEPFYTALSPTGALVQLRRYRYQKNDHATLNTRVVAVTGALYSADTKVWPIVTTNYDERDGHIVGSHYFLGHEPTQVLVDTSLSELEQAEIYAQHCIQEESRRNQSPAVHFTHSAYHVRWENGYTEALHDARSMPGKIQQVIDRGLGAQAVGLMVSHEKTRLGFA